MQTNDLKAAKEILWTALNALTNLSLEGKSGTPLGDLVRRTIRLKMDLANAIDVTTNIINEEIREAQLTDADRRFEKVNRAYGREDTESLGADDHFNEHRY